MNNHIIIKMLFYFVLVISGILIFAHAGICELVYINPGHGGSDPGSLTHISGYTEDDINMEIGWELKEILENPPGVFHPHLWDFEYTRLSDSSVLRADRIRLANEAFADAFVSIHHNSDTSVYTQYTVTLYSGSELTCDTEEFRNNTDSLAKKMGLRLQENFKSNKLHAPWDTHNTKTVLCRSEMPSVITEASFISQPVEADSFYYNWDNHIEKEALALWTGITSFFTGNGFVNVDYYSNAVFFPGDIIPTVKVDDYAIYEIPYETCWLENENHMLEAVSGGESSSAI